MPAAKTAEGVANGAVGRVWVDDVFSPIAVLTALYRIPGGHARLGSSISSRLNFVIHQHVVERNVQIFPLEAGPEPEHGRRVLRRTAEERLEIPTLKLEQDLVHLNTRWLRVVPERHQLLDIRVLWNVAGTGEGLNWGSGSRLGAREDHGWAAPQLTGPLLFVILGGLHLF
jgi:hypothetical protein